MTTKVYYVIYLVEGPEYNPYSRRLHINNYWFEHREDAEKYADTINPGRQPQIVEGYAMPVCDRPECYHYAQHSCLNSPEGREALKEECALNL